MASESDADIVRIVVDDSQDEFLSSSSRSSSSLNNGSDSEDAIDDNVDGNIDGDVVRLGSNDVILRCCHVGNAEDNSIGYVYLYFGVKGAV